MIHRLESFLRLAADERQALVEAWSALLLLAGAVRVLSLPRLLAVCRALSGGVARGPGPSVSRLVSLVEVAGRYAPGATCLTKALAAGLILRRRGIATTLSIGVSRRGRDLTAHAWLEAEGRVLLGHQEREAYEPIFTGSLAA